MHNLPPQNTELEESILATILIHPDDDLFELVPSDFYSSANAGIYKICLGLFNARLPVDISSISNELKKTGSEIPVSYLSGVLDAPPVIDNEYSIAQLRGYANLRRMLELSNSLMKRCYQAKPEDVEKIVDELQRDSLKIGSVGVERSVGLSSIINNTLERCEIIAQNKGLIGVPTGYELLDQLLCGFQPADLIILGARPSMGKTAFAINAMLNAAAKGCASDFYSLEMANVSVGTRFLTVASKINSQKFRSGRFSVEDWTALNDAAGKIYNYPIQIDDTPCSTYQEIAKKARKSKKQNDTKIIWIDYLSFLDGDKGANKVQEVESITRALKSLAKELNIPIVLICQLNRSLESRSDKRPILSDLRDSGAIEQDADVVLFLYRDEMYNKSETNPNIGVAEIDVAKQRNGPTGRVKLSFLSSFTRFENLATSTY
jgi:replicative DNA helicase